MNDEDEGEILTEREGGGGGGRDVRENNKHNCCQFL